MRSLRLLGLGEIRSAPISLFLFLVLVLRHSSSSSCWCLTDKGVEFLRSGEEIHCSSTEFYCSNKANNLYLRSMGKPRNLAHRKLMEASTKSTFNSLFMATIDSVLHTTPSQLSTVPMWAHAPAPSVTPSPVPAPAMPLSSFSESFITKDHQLLTLFAITGGSLLVFVVLFACFLAFCRKGKMGVVKPWASGLSGQLQRAFVTGVPSLKRQELEIACEDFSNVVGALSFCTLYKGILSSGVEIAVISFPLASAKDWSRDQEAHFRKKIDNLSKVNHKNFVNLIGFCVEREPFTRMMVFEYAPNGTLFEHLHCKEAEHLDWGMRMRIVMGVAYCLSYMHHLSPPVLHQNLKSSAIHLAEDYAAKVWDFDFRGDELAHNDADSSTPQSNVYNFGVILLEVVMGRQPKALKDFVSEYLHGRKPLREMADPSLGSFEEEQNQQMDEIGEVIKLCLRLGPRLRPTMTEVCGRLREITGIGPDGAVPKASPLWWAELEILSAHETV
ncbi:unnamed protein product [Cuscuta campestris]|uniref:Protein kinase domain-containing protein n=1 Tax=Cuscuta campestris TaxID=132261 RepID=A0A484NI45_9ASTE|nr:unnamed protein product [Cuscuta campestris]